MFFYLSKLQCKGNEDVSRSISVQEVSRDVGGLERKTVFRFAVSCQSQVKGLFNRLKNEVVSSPTERDTRKTRASNAGQHLSVSLAPQKTTTHILIRKKNYLKLHASILQIQD